jgi:hypothetical protein
LDGLAVALEHDDFGAPSREMFREFRSEPSGSDDPDPFHGLLLFNRR